MNTKFRWAGFALLALLTAGSVAWDSSAVAGLAQEKSVKPGINDMWKSREIAPLVERLEAESREIYSERAKLADLVGLREGMSVADVGAGSGFMVEEFARRVGSSGKVYAVDINEKLLERIAARAREQRTIQVRTLMTREDSVDLRPATVDLVFLCDTYHHFEYPQKSLAGIHSALRDGGELVVVEFKRVPGKTEDWLLEHVRAGQEEFTSEIEAAGFTLVRVEPAPFLSENYVLRFRKK